MHKESIRLLPRVITILVTAWFYAPWCGHCQNLKPAYEAAAKSLAGIAKVAAVNCDDKINKPFCGKMGVQGFPTLKIVRPGKKLGKPTIEDYQGPRQAKGIVEAVKDMIPNNVVRVTDKTLDEWLQEKNETAKVILFSDKGLTSTTLQAMSKAKKDNRNASKSSSKFSKASAFHKYADASSAAASAKDEVVEGPVKQTESPDLNLKDEDTSEPIIIPEEETKPTIPLLAEPSELQASSLNAKSKTCIAAASALSSLGSIHKKHDAPSNPLSSCLLAELKLGSDNEVHLIATNAKREWWKKYSRQGFSPMEVEQCVYAIRMGEGKREKLPDSLLGEEGSTEVKEEKVEEQVPFKIEIEEIPDEEEKSRKLITSTESSD
ncbi:thioredoxin-domain-containing protein [Zopfia rhizophila CBS 207.26]|uniref:protein disulfide-isomerase n=1 Tax=Zopfia rhizophila CBS 207.26 TaxID=1314779 RepID=A0A6A6DNH5_9PEZI|nr:thioredoxin-domain-containing protein [Zopfia rhizophila CBS 207.26]